MDGIFGGDDHRVAHYGMTFLAVLMTFTNLYRKSHPQIGFFYAVVGYMMAAHAEHAPPTARALHRLAGLLMVAMGAARAFKRSLIPPLSIVWAVAITVSQHTIADCWPHSPSSLVGIALVLGWWANVAFNALLPKRVVEAGEVPLLEASVTRL